MPAGAPATVALRDGSSSGLSQRPMFWVEEAIVAWSWHRIEFLGILILPPKHCIVRHWRSSRALRLRRDGRPCARGSLAAGIDGSSAGATRL